MVAMGSIGVYGAIIAIGAKSNIGKIQAGHPYSRGAIRQKGAVLTKGQHYQIAIADKGGVMHYKIACVNATLRLKLQNFSHIGGSHYQAVVRRG